MIEIKVMWMGLGYQAESSDVEGIVGVGQTAGQAIVDFENRYMEQFDEYPYIYSIDKRTTVVISFPKETLSGL